MTPKVTVVMTAYNARSTIAAAVESVLQQSFTDLELLVLDDGSSDETVAALAAITDPRLRVEIRAHRGRPAALNEALTLAIGEYIALNDADDASLSDRIAQQVAYLDEHPDIAAVGGQLIATDGHRQWVLRWPTAPTDIARALDAGRMPISNACVMMRRDWLQQVGGYNESHTRLEDLELFHRTRRAAQFAALPTTLLMYRFRTFSYQQWAHEEQLRAAITNTSVRTGVLAYARYRIAVAAQRAGVAMTRSRRRS